MKLLHVAALLGYLDGCFTTHVIGVQSIAKSGKECWLYGSCAWGNIKKPDVFLPMGRGHCHCDQIGIVSWSHLVGDENLTRTL